MCREIPVTNESGVAENAAPDNVETPLFMIDDDASTDASESRANANTNMAAENQNLLSVDDLLDLVSDTTHQVGRVSVSVASDMPYMEMAGHCEALQMGKQQKLSAFAVVQQRQESLIRFSTQDLNVVNEVPSSVVPAVPTSGNPFVDANTVPVNQPVGNVPMHCAAAFQHFPHFQLPASRPYDNFLKAAGC